MRTMDYTETLVVTSCWCGISLAIPSNLHAHAKEAKGFSVYCPLGHKFVYSETWQERYEKEQRRVAEAQRQARATRDLLHQEERSHSATRGHLTRARKRAAAGVCPCCKRTFANVQRHVQARHPGFDPAALP